MPTYYFKKELPKNPLYDSSGEPIVFELLNAHEGYLQTDNEKLASELKKSAAAHRGGVLVITEADYAEFLKKKPPTPPSSTTWREELGGGMSADTLSATTPSAPPAINVALSMDNASVAEPVAIVAKETPPPVAGKRKTA